MTVTRAGRTETCQKCKEKRTTEVVGQPCTNKNLGIMMSIFLLSWVINFWVMKYRSYREILRHTVEILSRADSSRKVERTKNRP